MVHSFDDLISLMATLRSEQGCPWDREQTFKSLKTHLLEETYEVMDAVDQVDPERLRDELGDLLYQVIFYSQIAKESEQFDVSEVIDGVYQKLKRRHPHVFGRKKASTPDEALASWESRKVTEKGSMPFEFPAGLPALLKAYRTIDKARSLGLYENNQTVLLSDIAKTLETLRGAAEKSNETSLDEHFGTILLSLSALSHVFRIDPEQALQQRVRTFIAELREK